MTKSLSWENLTSLTCAPCPTYARYACLNPNAGQRKSLTCNKLSQKIIYNQGFSHYTATILGTTIFQQENPVLSRKFRSQFHLSTVISSYANVMPPRRGHSFPREVVCLKYIYGFEWSLWNIARRTRAGSWLISTKRRCPGWNLRANVTVTESCWLQCYWCVRCTKNEWHPIVLQYNVPTN